MYNNYVNPNFNAQNSYSAGSGYTLPNKGLAEIRKQDNMVGKVADSYSPGDDFSITIKSFLAGVLMSMGFTGATNWLMSVKNIPENMTQLDFYKNTRLYKIGQKLDNFGPFKFIIDKIDNVKNSISKIKYPEALKEIGRHIKRGSVAPWDKSGMYSLGKKGEAMTEFIEFLSKLDDAAIDKLGIKNPENVKNLLAKCRNGKIDPKLVFGKIVDCFDDIPAAKLRELSQKSSILAKLFGKNLDLNVALSKARFFIGKNASGPVGKAFNKFVSLVGEASGGGVLGGSTALFMNAVGLMSGFNAAQKAEKGDKLSAFMEDYIGLTLGGYLMSMVVGWGFNSFVGAAEMGMNKDLMKSIARKLDLEGAERVQELVIAYNKEFKNTKKWNVYLDKINKGKISTGTGIFSRIGRLFTGKVYLPDVQKALAKSGVDVDSCDTKKLVELLKSKIGGKNTQFFTEIAKDIKSAAKSKIPMKGNMKNWLIKKPVQAIAKLLSVGRYTLVNAKFSKLKRIGGGVGRMILVGIILTEPFRKLFTKFSHMIFGRPKTSLLDDKKEPTENNKTVPPNTLDVNSQYNLPSQVNKSIPPNVNTNLVDLYTANKAIANNVNNVNNVNNNKIANDSATYIPNQILTQESYVDTAITQELLTMRDSALSRADAAERNALDLISRV